MRHRATSGCDLRRKVWYSASDLWPAELLDSPVRLRVSGYGSIRRRPFTLSKSRSKLVIDSRPLTVTTAA